MNKKPGDTVRITARGKVCGVSHGTGQYVLELLDIQDRTKAELVRILDKDGILDSNDLALIFGEDL